MHYRAYIYVVMVIASLFVLSGVNFEKIMKRNKVVEARLLMLFLSFALGYLLTNFIVDFLASSQLV